MEFPQDGLYDFFYKNKVNIGKPLTNVKTININIGDISFKYFLKNLENKK